jgi:hypothetical protein
MDTSFLFSFFKGLLFLLPETAVFTACVYYFIRQKSPDSILLSMGSLVSMAVMVFYNLLLPIIQRTGGADFIYSSFIFEIVGIISFIGHVSFAIGFFMLVLKCIKLIKGAPTN